MPRALQYVRRPPRNREEMSKHYASLNLKEAGQKSVAYSPMSRSFLEIRRPSFFPSHVVICYRSRAGESLVLIRLAREPNGTFGCSGFRNSLPLSRAIRQHFQKSRSRVLCHLAVPAEKRNMAYQRGSLKKVHRKEGETWVLRFRVTNAEGRRVEHTLPIGLVRDFSKDDDAWGEVDRLGLGVRINNPATSGRVSFRFLAEHYLKADFGADAVRPKSANTIPIVEHYVRDYLIKRFGEVAADDIKPLDIQRWLESLNEAGGLAWTTISKIRGIMLRIYKIGIRHEHVRSNPVEYVETSSKSNYQAIIITPAQTLAILKSLPSPLHFALVLTCAATALRASEILALRWSDILWGEGRIRISKRWAKGEDGETKTDTSDGYVRRLCPITCRSRRTSSRLAKADAIREANGFCLSVDERSGQEAAICFQLCRRLLATRSQDCGCPYRERPEVRTSQLASQLEQLAREQGESGA